MFGKPNACVARSKKTKDPAKEKRNEEKKEKQNKKWISNIAYELCETNIPEMRGNDRLDWFERKVQHQKYSHDVMKEYDKSKNLEQRDELSWWLYKILKYLGLQSTIDTTPFTEEALQQAAITLLRKNTVSIPKVECGILAFNEDYLIPWSGTKIVRVRYGKNDKNQVMYQFKPKFTMDEIPKAPANSIVLMDGTIVHPTPDES